LQFRLIGFGVSDEFGERVAGKSFRAINIRAESVMSATASKSAAAL